MKRQAWLIAIALMSLVQALPCFAQQAEQEQQDTRFKRDVRVTMHLLDVSARDESGQYVVDLKKEEIKLEVDGREVPIASLDSYYPMPATGDWSNIPGAKNETGLPPRYLVLFFDRSYSSMGGIIRAKAAARDFVINNFERNDRFMVVSYDRGLRVDQPFTNDRDLLLAAVNGMKAGFYGFASDGPKSVREQTLEAMKRSGETVKDARELEAKFDARLYLNNLKRIADYLKAYRGRKTLLLFTQGCPELAMQLPTVTVMKQDTSDDAEDEELDIDTETDSETIKFDPTKVKDTVPEMDTDLVAYLQEAAKSFNDANTVIFPVDIAGVRPGGDHDYELGSRASLFYFADATGGEFYYNTNDVGRQLELVGQDINHYYVIGFVTEELEDGRFHRISLSSSRPGIRLRYGQGYRAPREFGKLSWEERLAHLEAGFSLSTPLREFDARVQLFFFPMETGTVLVNLVLHVPLTGAPGIPEFEVFGVLTNGEEEIDSFHKTITFKKRYDDKKTRAWHTETIAAEPGDNALRMVIRDNSDGKRFYWYATFQVNRLGDGEIVEASSIVPMEQRTDDTLISTEVAEIASLEKRLNLPTTESYEPIALLRKKGLYATASQEFDRDTLFTTAVRVVGYGSEKDPHEVGASYYLIDENDQPLHVKFVDHNAFRVPGSASQIVVTVLDMSDLPQGEYTLVIKVMDMQTKQFKERRTRIVLR